MILLNKSAEGDKLTCYNSEISSLLSNLKQNKKKKKTVTKQKAVFFPWGLVVHPHCVHKPIYYHIYVYYTYNLYGS